MDIAPSPAQIDVRLLPPRERHPLIFSTFEQLPVGGWIDLLSDHEPVPLKAQFEALWAGQFDWTPLACVPGEWRIRIARRPSGKACCGCCGG